MPLNLKLLCGPTLEIVDSMIYRQMISSLMYLTNMRSDIFFMVNTFDLGHGHMIATKHVMGYLNGTLSCDLIYASDCKIILECYADSNLEYIAKYRESTSVATSSWEQEIVRDA